MDFYILASGSKGNATLVTDGKTRLLIDMGLTKKAFEEALLKTPYRFQDIDYVIFTHEHSDHVKGVDFFPIEKRFATKVTTQVLPHQTLKHYEEMNIGTFMVVPLPISHDAKDPIGLIIISQHDRLVYMTDTGYISEKNIALMKHADYYIIESNHDVKMLLQTERSQLLKHRILGDTGHLSNEDAALCLTEMVGPKTKQIFLAHLSEEANTEAKALDAFVRIFRKRLVPLNKIHLQTAKQYDVVLGGQSLHSKKKD
jgi:phosphoribosyl 1,2-cyclic phosphodiesterase